MQIHELAQGSREWLAYRANHFNASDAPAMMGVSPYKTRTELLHELHTGSAPEVDAGTQRRFDDGHRFEALARPLAEDIIGQDLYPVVGSEGRLSASFDGLTMAEDINFEHKSLNDALRAAMIEGCTGADLPIQYQIQMEQQHMVSGAAKTLFMASKWNGDDLIEERHCWYESSADLAEKIKQGWDQFAIDLAAYAPVQHAGKSAADTIMQLPALAIQIRSEVVTSNLPAFRDAAAEFIANIKTELETDEDFANAEATVKFCEAAEKNLELTKSAALGQTASIDELMKTIDFIQNEMRTKRLMLNKLVTTKKASIKDDVLLKARDAYADHVTELESEIKPIRIEGLSPDFPGAAKNKRTLASLHDAVDTELANAKITADAAAKDIRVKLAWCKSNAEGYGFLFKDMQQLVSKAEEDFQLVVTTRIAEHKKLEDEKAEQLRADTLATEQARVAANAAIATAATLPVPPTPPIVTDPPTTRSHATPLPAAAKPEAVPDLRLGQIGERLGFTVTAEFLRTLGFEPAGRDRAAVLYQEGDFDGMCAALINHLSKVRQQQLKAA